MSSHSQPKSSRITTASRSPFLTQCWGSLKDTVRTTINGSPWVKFFATTYGVGVISTVPSVPFWRARILLLAPYKGNPQVSELAQLIKNARGGNPRILYPSTWFKGSGSMLAFKFGVLPAQLGIPIIAQKVIPPAHYTPTLDFTTQLFAGAISGLPFTWIERLMFETRGGDVSSIHAIKYMFRNQSLRGLIPICVRESKFVVTTFFIQSQIIKALQQHIENQAAVKILSAIITGMIICGLTQPDAVLAQQMMLSQGQKSYPELIKAECQAALKTPTPRYPLSLNEFLKVLPRAYPGTVLRILQLAVLAGSLLTVQSLMSDFLNEPETQATEPPKIQTAAVFRGSDVPPQTRQGAGCPDSSLSGSPPSRG